MKTNNQSKTMGSQGNNNAEAFDALIGLIEECRGKPSFDYQRIIVCHANSLNLGPKLSQRLGVPLIDSWRPLNSKRVVAVLIVANAGNCSVEMLESVVFYVNRTRGVVVLLIGGQSFEKWPALWLGPAAQIHRRTHATI